MRQDTKVLLGRLGEESFKYYDFESPSAETDVWPMFEALLLDERVVGKIAYPSAPGQQTLEPQVAPSGAAPLHGDVGPTSPRPAVEADEPGLFGKYDAANTAQDDGESVRELLQRLVTLAR
jgi:hypothetical protein